jgi:hypothetical protein
LSQITIDLVKFIGQIGPQVSGSIDPELLQQWLSGNTGLLQLVTVDLVPLLAEDVAETPAPPLRLRSRINDVTTFGDDSILHVRVLALPGSHENLASNAYYTLLGAISDI